MAMQPKEGVESYLRRMSGEFCQYIRSTSALPCDPSTSLHRCIFLCKLYRLSEEEEAREFCSKYGVKYVRGAEVYEVRDQSGNIMNDPSGRPDVNRGGPAGSRRTYKVSSHWGRLDDVCRWLTTDPCRLSI